MPTSADAGTETTPSVEASSAPISSLRFHIAVPPGFGVKVTPRYRPTQSPHCRMSPIWRSDMSDTHVGECGKLSGSSTEMSPMTVLSEVPRPEHADLEAHWMPFTANRQFKAAPRLLVQAEGM